MTRLLALLMLLLASCATMSARPDRTEGLGLELFWRSADNSRAGYYTLSTAGDFTASGGVRARDRAQDFRITLSPVELERFVVLVRATAFDERPADSGTEGDRSEVTVVHGGKRRTFKVAGADAAVDALLGYCRELSLRQFRDVIDAQPQSGERRR